MTKEEIKDFCDMKVQLEPENEDIFKAIVKMLEQEPTTKNDLGADREDAIERLNAFKQFIGYDKDSEIVKATQKSLDMAIKALEQEPRWIPVTERLPEEKIAVLLSCDDMYLARLNPCIGWRNGNYWHTFSAKGSYLVKYPIAWMPLTEPYKAESEGV